MTEAEIEKILNKIDSEDLEALENYYNDYNHEIVIINKLKNNLESFKKERNLDLTPSEKELEIKKTLETVKRLSKKRRHKIEGTLNDNQRIKSLKIDEQDLNPSLLQSKEYSKIFFKKSGNYVTNAVIFLIIGIILLALGMNLNLIPLKLISIITLFPAFMNIINAITNDTLESVAKYKTSQKRINAFNKKLTRDYEREKMHSENMHMQNLAFLDSKEDIFEKMLEKHQTEIAEIAEKIREILGLDMDSLTLTKEEQIDTEKLITKGHKKILKRSH